MSKTIVIQPGGYHPFHAGHYALYKSAVDAFPGADVYVAATNDQKARPFPFAIKEKLAKIAGVAPGHFVQVSSPFKAAEITSHYNPDQDVLIFVRSEKDRNEQPKPGGMKKDGTPAYFQPYTGKGMQPFSKHAYFAYLPTVEFGPGITSATEIRNAWPTLNNSRKTAMVMSLYPATKQNPKLAANVVKLLDMGMSSAEGLSEGFNWTDYDGLGMNERLMIAETYFTTNRNLFESNDSKNSDYFLSLTSMSSLLVTNKKYIVSVLALISDNVMQLQYPEVVTLLGQTHNKYRVQLSNGSETEFPNKHLSDKMTAETFFFDNVNAYEQFRSIVSLKYDFSLVGPDEINGNEDHAIDEGRDEALQYATQAHAGQTRAGGLPYITHPMSVANSIEQYKKSHNLDAIISAALLHDTVEDTTTTHEDLEALFGGLVASLVQELTSDKEKIAQMGKAEYLAQKMAKMSSYALVIKLADRLDNVQDIATAKTPEWRAKYRAETEKILNYIEKHRALSGTHRKFIDLIRNKLGEIEGAQGVAEGWKEKVAGGLAAAALAGAAMTGYQTNNANAGKYAEPTTQRQGIKPLNFSNNPYSNDTVPDLNDPTNDRMKLKNIDEEASSSLPDVLYHGGENLISKFKIPPYGVFFSPHEEWAENYGDVLTQARVNATKVYVTDSSKWNDPNTFDAKVLDALFDRDYKTLAVCIKVLRAKGYQALQTQTDSEMVVVFPGTEIQVLQDVDEQFTTNLTTEGTGMPTVRQWMNQVRSEHGSDVKFFNKKSGAGIDNRVIARDAVGEIVGSYDRNAQNGTVFAPQTAVVEDEQDPQLSKPIKPFNQVTQYPLTALL